MTNLSTIIERKSDATDEPVDIVNKALAELSTAVDERLKAIETKGAETKGVDPKL